MSGPQEPVWPRIGSLFSGYGGLDLGVRQVLGGEVVWHAEVDPGACAVLGARHPGVPQLGDVTAVDWATVPAVEVLTGGFPCQDVSVAGRRAGLRPGTRSGLWAAMRDAVAALRPRLVVVENVRGLLTAEGEAPTDDILRLEADRDHLARSLALVGRKRRRAIRDGNTTYAAYHRRDTVRLARRLHRAVGAVRRARAGLVRAIGAVLRDLAELGYDAAWCGLRAADVGAPHGRHRVFVLAWPAQDPDSAAGGQRGHAASGQAAGGRALADAGRPGRARDVTLLPTPDATAAPYSSPGYGPTLTEVLLPTPDATHGRTSTRTGPLLAGALLPTPAVNDMGAGKGIEEWDGWTARMRSRHGNGNGHGASLALRMLPTPRATDGTKGSSGDLMLPSAVALMPTPTTDPATGNEHARNLAARTRAYGQYAEAVDQWERVTGHRAPPPTEPTGRDGRHRLAPAFVEWMMGLSPGHVTDLYADGALSYGSALRMLGNGVVPQQAAEAMRHLLGVRETWGAAA